MREGDHHIRTFLDNHKRRMRAAEHVVIGVGSNVPGPVQRSSEKPVKV